jgi:hypothetical protein
MIAAVCPVSRSAPNSLPPALSRESTCVHGVAGIVRPWRGRDHSSSSTAWPYTRRPPSAAPRLICNSVMFALQFDRLLNLLALVST